MSELLDGQFELDGKLKFGLWLPIVCLKPGPDIGEASVVTDQDADNPRMDGVRFGRDYRRGRTLTFDLAALAEDGASVEALCGELEAAWLADDVRLSPGKKSVLRYRKQGVTRRVYGRPRKIAPTVKSYWSGKVAYTAEFTTADHRFFEDELQTTTVSLIPPEAGGLLSPLVSPATTVQQSASQGSVVVGGNLATPVTIRIYGPIAQPVVQILDHWTIKLNGTLAADDWVEIDALAGTVLTRYNKNWCGKFTQDSPVLGEMLLPPGPTTAVLRGTDQTGSARMDVSWRNCTSSF